jgi:bifunctional DNase/RNase
MKLVEVVGLHIETTSGTPLVLLREHDEPHRVLPIFVGDPEAASIALALSGESAPRPLTHDVMAALMTSVDAHVDAVEVTELRDGAFVAELAITGPSGGTRLDTRPSDAIALALRLGAPLFVSDAVLDEAGTVLTEEPDEEAIEEEVAEFRSLLDELDPAHIAGVIAELPAAPVEGALGDGDPGPDEVPGPDGLDV